MSFIKLFSRRQMLWRLDELDERAKWLEMSRKARSTRQKEARERIEELEREVGTLALVLASLLDTLDESGVISRSDLQHRLERLDLADGTHDDQLDPAVLRDWLNEQ